MMFKKDEWHSLPNESVCSTWRLLLNSTDSEYIWINHCFNHCGNRVIVAQKSGDDTKLRLTVDQWKRIAKFVEVNLNDAFQSLRREEVVAEQQNAVENEQMDDSTLIYDATAVSSVDFASQGLDETLPNRNGRRRTFWSSTGSVRDTAVEWATYQLRSAKFIEKIQHKKPLLDQNLNELNVMLIDKVKMKPFQANWQNNNVYAPKKIIVSIGTSDQDFSLYRSQEFAIENTAQFHELNVGPLLIISKYEERVQDHTEVAETMQDDEVQNNADDDDHDDEEDDEEMEDEEMEEDEQEGEFASISIPELLRTSTQEEITEAYMACNGEIGMEFIKYLIDLRQERIELQKLQKLREERIAHIREQATEKGELFIKLDMIGKHQTQPNDDLYYTCIEILDVTGTATVI